MMGILGREREMERTHREVRKESQMKESETETESEREREFKKWELLRDDDVWK